MLHGHNPVKVDGIGSGAFIYSQGHSFTPLEYFFYTQPQSHGIIIAGINEDR